MSKPSIVFFGNERLSTSRTPSKTPALLALLENGYKVDAIFAQHTEGGSRKDRELEISVVAGQHNIPVFINQTANEILSKIQGLPAKLGVLAAFGKIVPDDIINHFELGVVNIHPSLLPKYRGPIPIEAAILDGVSKTGVSLMKLVQKMDAGPVYQQRQLTLRGAETKSELTTELGSIGARLLVETLPEIIDGSQQPNAQDESAATYCPLIQKEDGLLRPAKTASQLEREVRAYADWPTSYLILKDSRLTVLKTLVSDLESESNKLSVKDNRLFYGCKDGSLEILEIQPAGKKPMDAKSFINGYSSLLG